MRLLCDEMLRGVARWLRAAGHDAAMVAPGASDRAVLEQARTEGRVLLTCDRTLAAAAPDDLPVVLLDTEVPDAVAPALREHLGLNWLDRPFSRCLVDNTPLQRVAEGTIDRLPESARAGPGPILTCPACARVFWPGSHVRRMRSRLERWQAGAAERSQP